MLSPATRLLWRTPDIVHFEQGDRAVVVEGLPVPVLRRLATPGLQRRVGEPPPLPSEHRHALEVLAESGYLWPRPPDAPDARLAPPVPRLATELAALTGRHGERAATVLSRRAAASVQVTGASRLTALVASVLAAAGVGRVSCRAGGPARLQHAAPGGVHPGDEGRSLDAACEQAVLRAAPETDTRAVVLDGRADLTVLATSAPLPEDRRAVLHADDAPYLVVAFDGSGGIVGPLVLPGLTSCVRCADLHRRDRDPAWPALAVQLMIERRHGPAVDVATATALAGVAAGQALAFLDGDEPAVVEASLELHPPDWRLRRRHHPRHAECGCLAG